MTRYIYVIDWISIRCSRKFNTPRQIDTYVLIFLVIWPGILGIWLLGITLPIHTTWKITTLVSISLGKTIPKYWFPEHMTRNNSTQVHIWLVVWTEKSIPEYRISDCIGFLVHWLSFWQIVRILSLIYFRFETWVDWIYLKWYYNALIAPENLDVKVISNRYEYESAGNTSYEIIEIRNPVTGEPILQNTSEYI